MNRIPLTDEQIEDIAERAAEKAVAKLTGMMYQEIGKTVATKFFWIIGTIAVAVVGAYQAFTHLPK
jgi:hypothetical protein